MRYSVVILALALGLSTPGHASAGATTDFRVDVQGTSSFTGDIEAALDLVGITYSGMTRGGSLVLDGSDLGITVRRMPHASVQSSIIEGPGPLPSSGFQDEEFTVDGTIRVTPRTNATVIVVPQSIDQSVQCKVAAHSMKLELPVERQPRIQPTYERPLVPLGSNFRPQFAQDDLAIAGDLLVLVFDATISISGSSSRVIETGPQSSNSISPVPNLEFEAHDDVYAILAGRAEALFTLLDAWDVAASGIEGRVQGEVSFAHPHDYHGSPALHPNPETLLQVSGNLTFSSTQGPWHVIGETTRLRVDGSIVPIQSANLGQAALVATGGIGLLALLWWAAKKMGFELLAGYNRSEPLGNETRKLMLELVVKQPGINVAQLMAALNVRRPTIMFHARILQRGGYLSAYRRGAYWHFVPVGNAVAHSAFEPKSAAVLQHPLRACIVQVLREASGPTAAWAVARLVEAQGLVVTSPQMAYHLAVLVSEGVLSRQAQGRRVHYALGPKARVVPKPTQPAWLSMEIPA